jgi:hypothetical protein
VLESFTLATFEPYVGEMFPIHDGDERLETTLIAAQAVGSGGDGRDPFSVVFRGPPGVVLEQRIYRIDHPSMGTLELFIVPIGPDDSGMCYEAVFA